MLLKSKKSQSCTETQINTNEQNLGKKKTFGLSIKKKMKKGPNLLWVHNEGPKSMNGQVFDLIKQKKEKAQPSPTLKGQKKSLGA